MACAMCKELREERDRILKFTKKDKIAYHKEEKWYKITIAALIGIVVIMSIGVDNAIKIYNAVKDFF